jgi:heat shock protein HslJ
MPRVLPLALALALIPAISPAETVTGIDWQLLAVDGVLTDARATLQLQPDGVVSGAAPCNRWSATNTAALPALSLGPIRATRMACDRLADEEAFFAALSVMTALEPKGSRTLVLTGPDGRSMEFVLDVMNSLTRCTTCASPD